MVEFGSLFVVPAAPNWAKAPTPANFKRSRRFAMDVYYQAAKVRRFAIGFRECHTPAFSGGTKFQLAPGIAIVSANISPDPTTGIGPWREQDFMDRFAQYRGYVA